MEGPKDMEDPVRNCCIHFNILKHVLLSSQEFQLIDKKELAPLQELIDRLTAASNPGDASNPPSDH